MLAEDKFMAEMHLREPGVTHSSCRQFTKKTKKKYKNLKKQEFQDIFVETSQTKRSLNMIWLMENLTIWLEEQLLVKYYVMEYLILLKI